MPAATETTARSDADRRLTRVVVGLSLLPFAVSLLALFLTNQGRVFIFGDTALTELQVRDVGHHVLRLGPYSRFHWNHPGPLMFDWLAIPYRLLGSNARALNAGSVITAAISVGVIAFVMRRRGGTRLLAWSMIIVGVLVWALGAEVLRTPWNPWITILPLFAVLVLAWEATTDAPWSYPVAVAGGSFLVQSHVGYAGVTTAILGGAAAILIGQAVRGLLPWRKVGIVALVSAGTLLVLWTPTLYQEVRGEPGNLSELQRFFSENKSDHDFGDGIDAVMHKLGTVPAQLTALDGGAARLGEAPTWSGVLTLVALVAAFVVGVARRAWSAVSLAGLITLSIVAAAWSMANVLGPIENYLVIWIAVAGAGAWVALGAAFLVPGTTPEARPSLRALVGILLALALVNSWNLWRAAPPEAIGTRAVPAMTREVRNALGPPSDGPILVRNRGFAAWVMAAASMIDLERRGYRTVVEPEDAWLMGSQRVRSKGERIAATLTFADPTESATLEGTPDQRLVARERALHDIRVFLAK